MSPALALPIIVSYLIGAVPFGFLIGRMKGVDIRQQGSGNIGATNVFRTLGKGLGILTFMLDVAKGFTAAYLIPMTFFNLIDSEAPVFLELICACSAVAGHNWPIYLKFKGGKGIATSTGALLGIAPEPLGIALLTWIIVFIVFRYVSLASILAAVSLGISGWLICTDSGLVLPSFLTLLSLLAIIRHKSNIQRLFNGSENRFEFKKKSKTLIKRNFKGT